MARVDEHRNRRSAAAPRETFPKSSEQRRRHEPGPVVGAEHRVAAVERVERRLSEVGGGGFRIADRPAIDPHDLLAGRVPSAGENTGLDRRPITRRPQHARDVDRRPQPVQQLLLAGTDEAHEPDLASERAGVGRRVAGAAGHDGGAVVLEDQNRGLARDAGGPPVEELVGDDVADHRDPQAGEPLGQTDEPGRWIGFAPRRERS
ncbi:MAG: hypothetical protein F4X11_03950 [Acidobacteria bacterium]|nr:hypothetical protein [Acidobacteriota bacterium]